jgi:hypothetical protein
MRQKNMRGKAQAQPDFLTVINLNQYVPADHPLPPLSGMWTSS